MSKRKKNKLIVNIEYFFALVTIFVLRLMPLPLAYGINNVLCKIFYTVDFYHRKRAIQHILHSGIRKNLKDAKKLALQSFIEMGKIWVEIIKFDQFVTPENVGEHVKLVGDQKALKTVHDPISVIWAAAHLGNWEISGLGSSILIKPIVSIARRFDNEKIGNYILNKRRAFKQEIAYKENAIRSLLKALKENKCVGILSDQHASTAEGVEIEFFGHPARAHTSPSILHIKTKHPLMVGIVIRKDNNFNFDLHIRGPITVDSNLPKDEQIKQLTQAYSTEIEKIIREYPEQWIWCHRRWLNLNRKWRKE